MSLATEGYRGDWATGIPLGMCMIASGKYDEARSCLSEARRSMRESGHLFDLERILVLEAEAAMGQGDSEDALELARVAGCVMKRKSTRADLDRIAGILGPPVRSEDRVGLQVV